MAIEHEQQLKILCELVRTKAYFLHFSYDDVQDCGQQFALWFLELPENKQHYVITHPHRCCLCFVMDYLRRFCNYQKHLCPLLPESGNVAVRTDPNDKLLQTELHERLESLLNRLPEAQRYLIKAHIYQQKTFQEIGDEQGRSADAARMAYHRALDHLLQIMEQEGFTEEVDEYYQASRRAHGGGE